MQDDKMIITLDGAWRSGGLNELFSHTARLFMIRHRPKKKLAYFLAASAKSKRNGRPDDATHTQLFIVYRRESTTLFTHGLKSRMRTKIRDQLRS